MTPAPSPTSTASATCRSAPTTTATTPVLELRADRQPRAVGRLRVGRLHEPAHVRQRRDASIRSRAIRAAYDPTLSATTKKLWVAAIDLNATPGTDPSHPAFYLPAQELLAGNSRGYWVVDPCEPNGDSCITGDECCSGYCQPTSTAASCCGHAASRACSALSNKCTMASDCCGAAQGIQCIDGFCAQPDAAVGRPYGLTRAFTLAARCLGAPTSSQP